MKLSLLLASLLPLAYAETLGYASDGSDDIASFTFSWEDPDESSSSSSGLDDYLIVTDGDTTTGEVLSHPAGYGTWGSESGSTQGFVGRFVADTLNAPTGYSYWTITSMEVTFKSNSGGCFGSKSEAQAFYTDRSGNTAIIGDAETTISGSYITFTAPITSTGVATVGEIGFTIEANTYCSENVITVTEFVLEGEATKTPEPTAPPTTKTPTKAPTASCTGQVTWGDPHFHPMAATEDIRFDYQGIDWYYYIFPCNTARDYENWPFFMLSRHDRCYWRNNPKGCVGMNAIVLNTKPEPWVIEFYGANEWVTESTVKITVGTDAAGQRAANFNTLSKKLSQYTKASPLEINYNDGQTEAQSGTVLIYFKKDLLYVELQDVAFNNYPGDCPGTLTGTQCLLDGEVIQISSAGSYTIMDCPYDLRNIACGLMGKYIRGDCNNKKLKTPSHDCYEMLTASDGTVYAPATNQRNDLFAPFAESWRDSTVMTMVKGLGLDTLDLSSVLDEPITEKEHHASNGRAVPVAAGGRAIDISEYEGECQNNAELVATYNETCRDNTVVKYEHCCERMGSFCDQLWASCVEDVCACSMKNDTGIQVMSVDECLHRIVHESMNTSCSADQLIPTNAPTDSPTPSPTEYDVPTSKVDKVMDLIWLYAIFVALFVLIAVGAYVYYKKKNNVKVYVPDDADMEMEEAEMNTSHGVET